jgi:RNA polymerase primary sigma factor
MSSRGELHWWLEQVGRHPLLTPAEEIHLATLVQAWQQHKAPAPQPVERRGRRARDRMINANLRLVVNIAKRYAGAGRQVDLLDLIQAGNGGLCRGVVKFDPARGYKFSTYAYWWIRQGITRFLEENSRTIRHPSSFSQRLSSIDRATRELICGLQRAPSVEELADALGMKPVDLNMVLGRSTTCVSLDAQMRGDSDNDALSALIRDPQSQTAEEALDAIAHQDQLDAMTKAIAGLPGRQQRILKSRWGLDGVAPATIRSIAAEWKVTPSKMSEELIAAQRSLRLAMAAKAPASDPEQPSAQAKAAPGGWPGWTREWRSGRTLDCFQLTLEV